LLIHHFYCMFDLLPDDSVLTVFLIFQCCCNVSTCPCLLLQSWIATRPDEQRDTLTKLFMSYVGEESPVEPGIMFDFIGRNCKEAMKTPKAGRASSCLVLLQSLLDDDDVELSASFGPDAQNDLNGEIERIFLYCICWSIGGLLEADDRTKFDAFLR
jgi:dynein heavy chain